MKKRKRYDEDELDNPETKILGMKPMTALLVGGAIVGLGILIWKRRQAKAPARTVALARDPAQSAALAAQAAAAAAQVATGVNGLKDRRVALSPAEFDDGMGGRLGEFGGGSLN